MAAIKGFKEMNGAPHSRAALSAAAFVRAQGLRLKEIKGLWGDLEKKDIRKVEKHVKSCPDCKGILEGMTEDFRYILSFPRPSTRQVDPAIQKLFLQTAISNFMGGIPVNFTAHPSKPEIEMDYRLTNNPSLKGKRLSEAQGEIRAHLMLCRECRGFYREIAREKAAESQERSKVAAASSVLSQLAAGEQVKFKEHPSNEQLLQSKDRSKKSADLSIIRGHILVCQDCRKTLRAILQEKENKG